MNLADYETLGQAAIRLGLTYETIRWYAQANRIPGMQRFGTHPMIPKEWVPERRKAGRKRKDAEPPADAA